MQKGKNERQPEELVWVEKNKQPSHINMLAARICMHVCVYQAYSNNEAKAHTHMGEIRIVQRRTSFKGVNSRLRSSY